MSDVELAAQLYESVGSAQAQLLLLMLTAPQEAKPYLRDIADTLGIVLDGLSVLSEQTPDLD